MVHSILLYGGLIWHKATVVRKYQEMDVNIEQKWKRDGNDNRFAKWLVRKHDGSAVDKKPDSNHNRLCGT